MNHGLYAWFIKVEVFGVVPEGGSVQADCLHSYISIKVEDMFIKTSVVEY